MRIETELDQLMFAIDTIARTAPPPSGNITFLVANGKLNLTSVSDLSRCTTIVPCESVEGEAEFAVPMMAIRDAIKGRKKISLKMANSVLSVKSGNYQADLAILDSIPSDNPDEEAISKWKVDQDQRDWLKQSIKDVALKPTAILSSWIPVGVCIDSKGAFVACYDEQHMSWVKTKKVTGDINCVLPLDTIQSIIEVFRSGFLLVQGKSSIRIKDKLTSVVLSIPSTEDVPALDMVKEKVTEASKMKSDDITISKNHVTDFMYNAKAVLTKERAELVVKADGKKCSLLIQTVNGKVENTIKCTGNASFKVDLEYFQELIGKAPEEVVIGVVADSFLSIKLNNSHALVALNQ